MALSLLRLRLLQLIAAGLCALGVVGLVRYLDNFWLYRGYPAPREPAYVKQKGYTEVIRVRSGALAGRAQKIDVYLPPRYRAEPMRRYPVLYLLHGVPGLPEAFLRIVRAGIIEDELVARGRARPLIVVMPSGSTGLFTDKEWADGVGSGDGWETFVARDLVHAIDARYRTIRRGAARAIAGLSEGGYGALNIGLHHPGEFRVLESWSGYERAQNVRSIFGHDRSLLAYNSPLEQLPRVARELRRAHTFIWFYSGKHDPLRPQNDAFAALLTRFGVRHRFLVLGGGHDWRLWRGEAEAAILAAERALYGGTRG
ncbi:MAG: alpha/beta hydrolase-fold protein [Gaiellaceae bacterium]